MWTIYNNNIHKIFTEHDEFTMSHSIIKITSSFHVGIPVALPEAWGDHKLVVVAFFTI